MENLPKSFKAEILSQFTRRLILSSKNAEIFRLREILKESGKPLEKRIVVLSKEDIKENIRKRVKSKLGKPAEKVFDKSIFEMQESKPIQTISESIVPHERRTKPIGRRGQIMNVPKRILRIPETRLPERLRDIRPIVSEKTIDIGKLNPLVQDPNVASIETTGEGERVKVSGNMGTKPTNITLSKEEIAEVINRFSMETKIPQHEGLFKAIVGNLILTAMISESVSSRFIIKKLQRKIQPKVPVSI